MSPGDATELFFALALLAALLLLVILWRYGASLRRRAASARRLFVPVLAAGALGVFAKIASEVQERETTSFDRAVSLRFHRLDTPAMDAAMRFFTFLGSLPAIAAVVVSACVWRLKRGDRRGAAMLAGVTVATEVLNLALKETFRRSRPSLFQEIATLHSYSFPSGHAMASAAVYGAVAVLVAREIPSRAPIAFAGAAILSLLIGASRIYLGVHWVTDVLAGWAAGLFVLVIATYLLTKSDAREVAT